ncbi:MAG: beta-hydroxyacyl-ACP dehydratase [Deltaproteobacteria bacterium HGW-Deltaproteobacteria-2]|jgi:3-hydroxyacyl-[acyl-carrier-protein] dehydratase|nr:MAG: beta-hydroxyacyl-ACP dehydratase [Deltaproteobacteria bacterium HGW-Deltaproteobacteria-2]
MEMEDVLAAIPQRPPFLFVDKIISKEGNSITTQRILREDEFYFQGHFPGNPIMPGVLLCEACFQTGAILMGASNLPGLGVVTRIKDTKFKNFARPGDTLTITVTLDDKIDNAFYMSGTIRIDDKLILKIIFQAALLPPEN